MSTMRVTTLRERIMVLLDAQRGRELCSACIARELGVRHKAAHQAALKLEASRGFRRQYGRCSICRKTRLVASAVDTLPGPEGAPDRPVEA